MRKPSIGPTADARREAAFRRFRRRWQRDYGPMVRRLERDLPELLSFFALPRHLWKKAAHHQHHRALFRRSAPPNPAHGLLRQRAERGPNHLLHLPELQPGMEKPHPQPFYTSSLTSPRHAYRVDFSETYRQTLNSPVHVLGQHDELGVDVESEAKADSGTVRSMSADRVSYTLDSTLETVNSAEETASRMAAEAGFDDEEIMKISMAVREAAVNAVLHGNAYDPSKKVTLAFERTAERPGHRHSRSGQRARCEQDSGSVGAGQPDEDLGARHFPDTLVYGCGGNPPVPNGHRT